MKKRFIKENQVIDYWKSNKNVFCLVGGYNDVLQSINNNGYTFSSGDKVGFSYPMKLDFYVIY